MGCSLSRAQPCQQPREKPLTPRPTAPPPLPLTIVETTTLDDTAAAPLHPAVASVGPVFAGVGAGSAWKASDAAKQALANAIASLEKASGGIGAPAPSLAIIASSKAADDVEDVRCELVRAMPESLLHGATEIHGATSAASLFTRSQSHSDCGGKRLSFPGDGVACLLLQAPEGSFAAAWDDTGDALYAARWLCEQMPNAKAILMATAPGQEERATDAIHSIFPGIPVYGSSVVKATEWVTMSHLGSSENGISLVGIGANVGFGAADVKLAPGRTIDFADEFCRSLEESYDAAMAAGMLKEVTAGIVTCRGPITSFPVIEKGLQRIGDVPILGVACRSRTQSQLADPSVGVLLFGTAEPQHEYGCRSEEDEETTSGSTAWPNSPATDVSTDGSGPECPGQIL